MNRFIYLIQSLGDTVIEALMFKVIYIFSARFLPLIYMNTCIVFFLSYFLLFCFSTSLKPHISTEHIILSCFQWRFKMNSILLPKCLWKPLLIFKLIVFKLYFMTQKEPCSHVPGYHCSLMIMYFICSISWHDINKNLLCSALSLTIHCALKE